MTASRRILLYRFSGALFFANISDFEDGLKKAALEDTRVIVVDAAGIGSVDVTAAERLLLLYDRYKEQGIRFYLAGHVTEVNAELRAFGAERLVTEGAVWSRISLALKDAGYTKPYPLVQRSHPEAATHSEHIAEKTWAYGPKRK